MEGARVKGETRPVVVGRDLAFFSDVSFMALEMDIPLQRRAIEYCLVLPGGYT